MSKYGGMTVNERIVLSGMSDAFNAAAGRRDRKKIIEILVGLEMSEQGAAVAADGLLAKREKYGFGSRAVSGGRE